jgi:exopolyphosphatase / guanosine-5'-triphosphate,3'-diphosphate pyrophosphatase
VSGPVAVVDLGSMSTRLLVTGGDGQEVRRQVVTRLGEGVVPGSRLGGPALERVRAALVDHRAVIDRAGAGEVAVVATAAARAAANAEELTRVVADVLGVEVDVLSAAEEARLAFAGATGDLDHEGPLLVLDIGGGSTEFSVGTVAGGVASSWSAEVGAGTLTDAYLDSDPPTPWELTAALSVVEIHVDDVIREVEGLGEALMGGVVVGVGGTITTVAAVELGLIEHDPAATHGLRLSKDAVEDVFRTVATEPARDRVSNPGLPADRVEVIVGGCCVLVEVMRRLGIAEVRVSERDLLDGVAAQRLGRA